MKISSKIKTIATAITIIYGAISSTAVFAAESNNNMKDKSESQKYTHSHNIDHKHHISATGQESHSHPIKHSHSLEDDTNNIPEKASQIVSKLSQGQAEISKRFIATPELYGYIINAKNGQGQSTIVYMPKDSSYVIFGNIVSANGNNLSQEFNSKYIDGKQAIKAYASIKNVSYITQGKNTSKHKMYIIIEPNCSACHAYYEKLQKFINDGTLQVRWVPVEFLRPNSKGKAAALLYGTDNAKKLHQLVLDESKFDMQHEQGGVKELEKSDSDTKNKEAFKKIEINTNFWKDSGFNATPVVLYVNQDGKPVQDKGLYNPNPEQLLKNIQKASSHWMPSQDHKS
jgi:thiol:disulfide interchange protein DsbG